MLLTGWLPRFGVLTLIVPLRVDPTFTPWIFSKAKEVASRFASSTSADAAVSVPIPASVPSAQTGPEVTMGEPAPSRNSKSSGNSRLFSTAVAPLASQPVRPPPSGPSAQIAGIKRGASPVEGSSGSDAYNKRRSLGTGGVPTAPRAHRQNGLNGEGDHDRRNKRSLLDRIGGPPLNPQAAEFGPMRMNGRGSTLWSTQTIYIVVLTNRASTQASDHNLATCPCQ
jgi:hypothetical protein